MSEAPVGVLILEDDIELRAMEALVAARCGGLVTEVGTLAEARKVLAEQGASFAVAIFDHNLPDGLGYELAEQIREDRPWPAVADMPIILVTAEDTGELLEATFDLDQVYYLKKPFSPARLTEQLRELLGSAHALD